MRNDMVECKRCGESVKRKREAQVYCSKLCSDAAKKQRKRQRRTQRSGDAEVTPIPVPRNGGSPATGLPTGSERPSGEQTGYKLWEGGPLQGCHPALSTRCHGSRGTASGTKQTCSMR